ncbi:RagB/SusD family nutrient uptake outer membrane protein [Hymenobacter sp.]|uniref:RagB/SusD family nutrient uptake outer membrane protein n=1 Tax=Hymenobacter sp. TaxID=1898978 RepID=UPI00286A9223|nr:RagB/SusD family nutrient uptake outer membrane protein [Hymenobacter sp.]
MKITNKSFWAALLLLTLASCDKEFLEEEPYTFYSVELYNTPTGANSVLNAAYASASNFNLFGGAYPQLLETSGLGCLTNQQATNALNTLELVPGIVFIGTVWGRSYEVIARTNDIIANVQESSFDEPVKNNILGQAYFLRGMMYFNLVRLYGGVPLRTEPTTQENTNIPRATTEQVYQQIIADLNQAATLLPEPAGQAIDRPHKYAAPALLGKVYIALAGNDPASPNWQLAKTELLKVVSSGAYILLPRFADLWDVTRENSREAIFEVQFSAVQGTPLGQLTTLFNPTNSYLTPLANPPFGQPFARIRVNKEIYDDHRTRYPGDPRFPTTFQSTFANRTNPNTRTLVYPDNLTTQGWPYMIKFTDPGFVSNQGNHNLIYLRYADVLLSLAEAENEINGPAGAYQYVNQVLARARTSATPAATQPANFAGLTKDQFRERILLERQYELFGEMHMWYDVRRKGTDYYLRAIRKHNNNPTFAVGFDFRMSENLRTMLLPLPENELNANTALTPADQNPGY